jgi:hypothetical protein
MEGEEKVNIEKKMSKEDNKKYFKNKIRLALIGSIKTMVNIGNISQDMNLPNQNLTRDRLPHRHPLRTRVLNPNRIVVEKIEGKSIADKAVGINKSIGKSKADQKALISKITGIEEHQNNRKNLAFIQKNKITSHINRMSLIKPNPYSFKLNIRKMFSTLQSETWRHKNITRNLLTSASQ